jgi:DNA-binding MarR family transcriptional regulator
LRTPHRPVLLDSARLQASSSVECIQACGLVVAAEAVRTVRNAPYVGLSASNLNGRGGVSQRTLVERSRGGEACQLEAFEQALALAVKRARPAFEASDGWVDRIRSGLHALLVFFDEQPSLARYLLVTSAQAGEPVSARRAQVLDQVAVLLDDERASARSFPPPLTAQAVASGVTGVLHARLSEPRPGPLVELAGQLMSFIVLPFLGSRAARRELAGPAATAEPAVTPDVLRGAAGRLNPRAVSVLLVIADDPGLNNQVVSRRSGVKDQGHISRILRRLHRLGLIENFSHTGVSASNAWRLTTSGRAIESALRREAANPAALACSFDLPREFLGRLDDQSVSLLKAIGGRPWLATAEVASRAGLVDDPRLPRSFQRLQDLGLVAGELEPHRRGTPNVWTLTAAGEQLFVALDGSVAARPQSAAFDLMHESGGRLSEVPLAALRAVGAEPGLSNSEVAARVGVADMNSVSQLLARLAGRGLVENVRNGGRRNVWQLTQAGETLERAVWHESPPAVQRRLALDLVRDHGGRVNHRVVAVLRVIAAEPGLSNVEISGRVGIDAQGHISILLSRLVRFGLIHNMVVDPAPFEANAWQLAGSWRDIEAAVRGDESSPAANGFAGAAAKSTDKELG